ncbi:DNA primase [Lentilactobacillus senioris]|uniref:DNA primase n=1 Tax=Lentilactobacillus senioris TaxID=931534 RepID=UPI00227F74F0|nr:DNA primase [Lentilactobacillus senioris]MCY9806796.1 DNA primase [Lentilactobacillus senioris]
MVKIPEATIEEIRSQTNITDVVSQYVSLHQAGKNLFGLCPFHEEKTASFSVSESKQIFHCFSCGRGGNVFTFLMDLENLSFPEAVVKVAEFEHIPLDSQYTDQKNNNANVNNSQTRELSALHEEAAKLYHHILMNTQMGQPALDYLHQRGMSDELINEFNLGYAPSQRLLKPVFDERKVDYQVLRKTGLFSETQDAQLIDRFVDRIMYPIRDASGTTIAFSGRLLTANPDLPKYLNSPETEIFNKGRVLFNLDKAKLAVREHRSVILFEGFMDVITAYSAGIKNGIASMGTSLTDDQVYDIKRIAQQVIISYDGDQPGQKATKRAIDIFKQVPSLTLGIVEIPDGKDPDEYIKSTGGPAFQELIKSAQPVVEYQLRMLKQDENMHSESGQAEYIKQALDLIATINSPIDQELYLNRLSAESKISKEVLQQQLQQVTQVVKRPAVKQVQQPGISTNNLNREPALSLVEKTERRLLKRMLYDRDVWLQVKNISDFAFIDEKYQMLYLLAEGYFSQYDQFQIATFSNLIKEPGLQQLLINIDLVDLPETVSAGEIDDYVNVIMNQAPLVNQIAAKKQELIDAGRVGDHQRQRQLLVDLIALEQKKRAK